MNKPQLEKPTATYCPFTSHKHHFFKKQKDMTYKDGNQIFVGFICSFCQLIKMKVLTYSPAGHGMIKALVKEVIPSGQCENEGEVQVSDEVKAKVESLAAGLEISVNGVKE